MREKPKRESVFLKKINRELWLDFITLADDEWISDRWSDEEIEDAFRKPDAEKMKIVLALFWRALDLESKRIIKDTRIIEITEDGEERHLDIDNQIERLNYFISGGDELLSIMTAYINTRANSNPSAKANEEKKPLADESSMTDKSLRSSPLNTGTQKKNIKGSHSEKSAT